MKSVGASEFAARCLSLLDEVSEHSVSIVILARGRPVARLVPCASSGTAPQETLRGTMTAADDLLDPPLPAEAWEALDR